MPVQALCVRPLVLAPTPTPICGTGGVCARSSHSAGKNWAAARGGGRSVTLSIAGGEVWLRGAPTGSPDAWTRERADFLSVKGLRGAYRKRWVVRLSNSDQGPEILEEKKTPSSEEDNGPPVLTIIAGLLVLVLVFWALGSLVSWIVGLLFKS